MTRTSIINQITNEVNYFDDETLKSIFNYISFLKNRDMIDPTDEILSSEEDYSKVREGLAQTSEGKTSHVLSLQQKELMKLSENAFSEWDNSEDEIYDDEENYGRVLEGLTQASEGKTSNWDDVK